MFDKLVELWLSQYSAAQWVLIFFGCSFIGWIWEVLLTLVKEHRFVNRGFLFGPILPIYGTGAVLVLLVCLPVWNNLAVVAIAGAFFATLLEYVTGAAMEALFHVRYWDYSHNRFNLNGYICLAGTAVWALFSVVFVSVVHPRIQPLMQRIPERVEMIAAAACSAGFAVDVTIAVRRALSLRALLETMDHAAAELEHLYSGLDTLSERIHAAVHTLGEDGREIVQRIEPLRKARVLLSKQLRDRRINMEEASRERFALFGRALAEMTNDRIDIEELRREIDERRAEIERRIAEGREQLRSNLGRTSSLLKRNPGAVSYRHKGMLEQIYAAARVHRFRRCEKDEPLEESSDEACKEYEPDPQGGDADA